MTLKKNSKWWKIIGMIDNMKKLEAKISLSPEETDWWKARDGKANPESRRLDFLISDSVESLIGHPEIRRQFVPRVQELRDSGESADPLMETSHSPLERVIHRYRSRIAFLATDRCFAYCRHCFRRRFTSAGEGDATEKDIKFLSEYISGHKCLSEILVTGGDPAVLPDNALERLLSEIRKASGEIIIRFCSRTLLSNPDRVTSDFVGILAKANKSAPLFFMTQFNCAREITGRASERIRMISDAGIALFNQSVLLKGVNDDPEKMESLCKTLLANRIKPYYVFQGDRVAGTEHLRTSVDDAYRLDAELRNRVSGLCMPSFMLDLPEGGGKIPLVKCYAEGKDENTGTWTFRTPDGARTIEYK